MSTRSKVFFGASALAALVTIPYVHYFQNEQRDVLHQGPMKDMARRARKRDALTPEQREREAEYEEQKRLHAELSQNQQVGKQ